MDSEEQKKLLSKAVGTVRASSSLVGQDVQFFSNLDANVASSVKELGNEVLEMINDILFSIDENSKPFAESAEQVGESWRDFTNLTDNLFEKSDRSMDIIAQGTRKNGQAGSEVQYLDDLVGNDSSSGKRITKPQLHFSRPVDNSESQPFKPLLTEKPNALKPLKESLQMVPATENIPSHYPNPYDYEISNQEYNNDILETRAPIPSTPWHESEPVWVDSTEGLQSLLKDLKKYKELAIDLEHHDYRSYYGIVCLMQISTRDTDYLVDTIALRDELHILNQVFTDPMVTKVFHGAFMDIIWLQRDLGLYIVSLFDTFHASKALGFPKHSLAYLLETLANFKTSKKYQLADWRIRPLSKPMSVYARADTHFLLNIFDQMRNQLIKDNKLAGVLGESRKVAKRRFEYSKFRPKLAQPDVFTPIEKESPWRTLMFQYNVTPEKEELVKALYEWRDTIARRDDESPRYIMPNQLLISLSAYTPTDPVSLVSVNSYVTDCVRSNSKVLANLIKSFVESSKLGPQSSYTPNTENTSTPFVLTLSQIKDIGMRFTKLTENFQSSSCQKISPLQRSSFFGDLSKGKVTVSYNDAKTTPVSQSVLESRSKQFNEYMKAFGDIEYKIPSIVEPVMDLPIPSGTTSTESADSKTVEKPPKNIKEDMDEIVVLKKVKRELPKPKGNDEDAEREIVDYSKEDKVLVQRQFDKKKKNNNNKKRFDPFSAISEGPKAPKKRKAVTKGKNASFKR
ncbi:exosome nuclease subunit RRP6 KNAG_0M01230 [Huiozyma naganishii CBS 8797]|uniref:HRDC domain-containing protein n=1 Tax=Huiozyma naganishii (strain ATCC MYA-139 / BCRC 22969 / CBS 8797 / KCTC 17520 / NBRC 10181 / NCYC 3082 / Yp74L-3) TaxID=1071383 RepID=J7SBE2_HUIN7|nr:hypothetical protein KNAG_0M01230 [Kazachstania naganishii CBS 8797]CCK72976.1 hypothetical protein KNAG_0M01230 [Kazachstania naganishii CBS 8797]